MPDLTVTQASAYAELLAGRELWPATKAWMTPGATPSRTFSRRTLQALVDAGLARWVTTPGTMPYITKLED